MGFIRKTMLSAAFALAAAATSAALPTGTTGVSPVADAQQRVPPAGTVTLHRLVLVFHGGDAILAEEV